ncbi:MAG: FAD-dependent oxidoreductase [Hyphomicrobiaceae bacterium]
MTRDPRYDVLFEPVRIGPVTARNRFYQVPHCCGMGYRYPKSMAAMRGMKAEGGWAVVSTEEVEIHPTADISPYLEGRLWDDRDIPYHARMCEAVHAHGSLAAIELCHNGISAVNRYSREVPIGPSDTASLYPDNVHVRGMSKTDIRDFRRWHRTAALRAKQAGFDIVYVYAAHNLTLLQHFLSRRYNHRTDEYGGTLENRARLLREVIEDTKEAVGDRCAIAVRFAVDELIGEDGLTHQGEGHDVVAMLAELPDLWDVNISPWSNDSQTARFSEEGFQEPYISFVKKLTTKPVVGVGRYTSPDSMVRAVKQGILDFIGAARPSIADPFLPRKIEDGRPEDIRECIGCNICVSGDFMMVPVRCTQNPTMGEEWRRGWHPEQVTIAKSRKKILVIGGGPAGLEATRTLGARGYEVMLAEALETFGGRVTREARLPGLATWTRVRDWRLGQIEKMQNVTLFPASRMTAADALDIGAEHIVVATGSRWRRDGMGTSVRRPIDGIETGRTLTPDDVLDGLPAPPSLPDGPIVLFDDDPYCMGGLMAEVLARAGRKVILLTPAAEVSPWTHNTLEQARIQKRLLELEVDIRPGQTLVRRSPGRIEGACVYTGRTTTFAAETLLLVTSRAPVNTLAQDLEARHASWAAAGLEGVSVIGDALAPATIAAAVYAGHKFARDIDADPNRDSFHFERESIETD